MQIWRLAAHRRILVRLGMRVSLLYTTQSFHCLCSHLALADADPLGVNVNVTFDEVGGLDERKSIHSAWAGILNAGLIDIHSLKEMTLLPLLYPEVFQRFNVTPPRGVLFHGPPGTGKTLLARALAASCRSNGKSICMSSLLLLHPHALTPIPSLLHAQGRRLPFKMGWRSRTTTPPSLRRSPRFATFHHLLRRDRRPRAGAIV